MTLHFENARWANVESDKQPSGDKPLFRPMSMGQGLYRTFGKRIFDIAFVIMMMPVALLLIGVAALFILRDGHAPFFTQPRIGRNGRIFRLWKLRTMVPGAEAKLQDYLARHPAAHKEWAETQKLKLDPRITWIGHFLRRTSLDELPQLWNVLKGEMSIVGPRPMLPEQRALYPGQVYFTLRPGITGLWQVEARNDCSFATRAVYDNAYERGLSLKADVGILRRTVGVVLSCTGH